MCFLPVIRRGTGQATVLACICHSSIWHKLQILQLLRSIYIVACKVNQVFLTFLQDLVRNLQLHGQL